MHKKPRFKPEITRVKLNPEQAVLACACYAQGRMFSSSAQHIGRDEIACRYLTKSTVDPLARWFENLAAS